MQNIWCIFKGSEHYFGENILFVFLLCSTYSLMKINFVCLLMGHPVMVQEWQSLCNYGPLTKINDSQSRKSNQVHFPRSPGKK